MKIVVHKAEERGIYDHGWLKTAYSFSFSSYYNPKKIHFGMLRVLNDDAIEPGMGFGTHPHDNMEIITIPLEGSLAHKDSMGNVEVIKSGEIQVMSAGTGIHHSEYNASDEEWTKLLQIWIITKKRNVKPRYFQENFEDKLIEDQLSAVVKPENKENGLWIHQDAWISLGKFENETSFTYNSHKPGNGVYFFVIEGSVTTVKKKLGKRDAIGISDYESVDLVAEKGTFLLAIDVPMH